MLVILDGNTNEELAVVPNDDMQPALVEIYGHFARLLRSNKLHYKQTYIVLDGNGTMVYRATLQEEIFTN